MAPKFVHAHFILYQVKKYLFIYVKTIQYQKSKKILILFQVIYKFDENVY